MGESTQKLPQNQPLLDGSGNGCVEMSVRLLAQVTREQKVVLWRKMQLYNLGPVCLACNSVELHQGRRWPLGSHLGSSIALSVMLGTYGPLTWPQFLICKMG